MGDRGLHRRELFQLGVAAGAVALGSAALPRSARAAQAFRFQITFEPGSAPVQGIDFDPQPLRFRGKRRPGKPFINSAVFRVPATPENDPTINQLKDWVKDAHEGKCLRKDITVELLDPATAAPVRTFNLIDTFPLHFSDLNVDTENPDVLHWTLEVRVNRWESA